MHLSIIQTNRKKQIYEKQIVESRKNKNLDLSYCVYYLIWILTTKNFMATCQLIVYKGWLASKVGRLTRLSIAILTYILVYTHLFALFSIISIQYLF